MPEKMPYQPTPEEIKQAEMMMTETQKNISSDIDKVHEYFSNEDIKNQIINPLLSADDVARILYSRFKQSLGAGGDYVVGEALSDSDIEDTKKVHNPSMDSPYRSAFIHEYLSLAKEFIKNNKDLERENKITAFQKLYKIIDSEFRERGHSAEYRIHSPLLKTIFSQVEKELEEEI